ncbi:MAG: YHS domain-containing protein [Candidatus Doudnabacteria bacterium]
MHHKIKSLIKKITKSGYFVKSANVGHKDPVCGMTVNDLIKVEHQDKPYYFCSDYCKEQFKEDPSAYV